MKNSPVSVSISRPFQVFRLSGTTDHNSAKEGFTPSGATTITMSNRFRGDLDVQIPGASLDIMASFIREKIKTKGQGKNLVTTHLHLEIWDAYLLQREGQPKGERELVLQSSRLLQESDLQADRLPQEDLETFSLFFNNLTLKL